MKVIKIYDADGEFVKEIIAGDSNPLFTWFDLIVGVFSALIIMSRLYEVIL